jgi:hypothetical protein
MGIATILLMDTAITRTDTTALIGTTAMGVAHTTMDTVTTVTIGIIATTITNVT